jgi:hypothetical protein
MSFFMPFMPLWFKKELYVLLYALYVLKKKLDWY